jgi:hypothetical protein
MATRIDTAGASREPVGAADSIDPAVDDWDWAAKNIPRVVAGAASLLEVNCCLSRLLQAVPGSCCLLLPHDSEWISGTTLCITCVCGWVCGWVIERDNVPCCVRRIAEAGDGCVRWVGVGSGQVSVIVNATPGTSTEGTPMCAETTADSSSAAHFFDAELPYVAIQSPLSDAGASSFRTITECLS